ATTTIPIVFSAGTDPVKAGIVASLRRPGANVTGVNYMAAELSAKRLSLLHELAPSATRIALLVNPANPVPTQSMIEDTEAAAGAIGGTSMFSKPKKAARSERPLLRSCRIGATPLLAVPIHSSSIVACRS